MSELEERRPSSRDEFSIAVLCALTLEADMVEIILDKDWTEDGLRLGKADGDTNTYTLGRICDKNVVLAYCSMGSNSAAQAVVGLRSSFTKIQIAFVVGVCGVAPYDQGGQEIVLGDCIVSTAVVQFDFGRQGPTGFHTKDGLDGLGRAGREITSILAKLKSRKSRLRLTEHLLANLDVIQKEDADNTIYPGHKEDRLFRPDYVHSHSSDNARCHACDTITGICGKDCSALGCSEDSLVVRKKLDKDTSPSMHFGIIGSSNTVMKSGKDRDDIVQAHKVIAFEMEGSGVWDVYPTIVVKAACDYADSHKNKKWQGYAAAVAAAGLKAILTEIDIVLEHSFSEAAMSRSAVLPTVAGTGITNHGHNYGFQGPSEGAVVTIHHHHSSDPKTDEVDGEVLEKAIKEADHALCEYYKSNDRLKIESISGRTLKLEDCYVNLALLNKTDIKHEVEPQLEFSLRKRLRLEANNNEQQISLEDLFESRTLQDRSVKVPKRIFIHGRAGVGKTTLCKKIVYEFVNQRLGNEHFDRLLWIPLRRLKSNTENYGWKELLRNTFRNQELDKIVSVMSKQLLDRDYLSRTLLLFDGLDEISYKYNPDDPMFEFLQSIMDDRSSFIITSRPHANSLQIRNRDLSLETVGFTTEQVYQYIETCINDKAVVASMKTMLAQKPLLQGLLRIPIQLDAFCYTWMVRMASRSVLPTQTPPFGNSTSNEDAFSTMTGLYQAIVDELCRKDIGRLGLDTQPQRLSIPEIRMRLRSELDSLSRFAFQGLLNGIATFSPWQRDRIEFQMVEKNDDLVSRAGRVLDQLSFIRTSDLQQDLMDRNYHFLHLTFQEFFAAYYFVGQWRSDSSLICLDLLHLSDEHDVEIMPDKFLQKEKYNPRLNIFWRFVTGLLQVSPQKQGLDEPGRLGETQHSTKDIYTFFTQLDSDPLDKLGAMHQRLLMYCLSEVAPSHRPKMQKLRQQQESVLRAWLVVEHKRTRKLTLAEEVEFPEDVICSFLETQGDVPHETILEVLSSRPSITLKSLRIVLELIGCTSSLATLLQIVHVTTKHARMEADYIRAFEICCMLLKDGDPDVRSRAVRALEDLPLLQKEVMTVLIESVKDEDPGVRRSTADALGRQSSPPKEAISILIESLKDKNLSVRRNAAHVLARQSSLPKEAISILIESVKNEHPGVRESAAYALGRQSSLPKEAISILIESLKDEDPGVRRNAVVALEQQSSLPKEAISILIESLKDEHPGMRTNAAYALGQQSSLPKEAISILIESLKDEDPGVRRNAVVALGQQSSLPKEAISILIESLKDEDPGMRTNAAYALGQQSSLPKEAMSILIEPVKDENTGVRRDAAFALARQSSLPKEAISILIELLKDEYLDVRENATYILARQSSLPEDAITALIKVFGKGAETAYDILSRHDSFYHQIVNLGDNRIWGKIWSIWLKKSVKDDITCYEIEGSLFVWSNGKRYEISRNRARTEHLLSILREVDLEAS